MDEKSISQHKRMAMGLSISKPTKVVKAMRGGGAVNKRRIKGLKDGDLVKKTGLKK
jgi:hypothetical protein